MEKQIIYHEDEKLKAVAIKENKTMNFSLRHFLPTSGHDYF